MTTKKDVLDTAIAAVADRGLNYGKPEDNFRRIAEMWNAHLRIRDLENASTRPVLNSGDVAIMMILMKVARLENTPAHLDSWVDIAGYAACGGEITGSEKDA